MMCNLPTGEREWVVEYEARIRHRIAVLGGICISACAGQTIPWLSVAIQLLNLTRDKQVNSSDSRINRMPPQHAMATPIISPRRALHILEPIKGATSRTTEENALCSSALISQTLTHLFCSNFEENYCAAFPLSTTTAQVDQARFGLPKGHLSLWNKELETKHLTFMIGDVFFQTCMPEGFTSSFY